jgi:hypothetical protein
VGVGGRQGEDKNADEGVRGRTGVRTSPRSDLIERQAVRTRRRQQQRAGGRVKVAVPSANRADRSLFADALAARAEPAMNEFYGVYIRSAPALHPSLLLGGRGSSPGTHPHGQRMPCHGRRPATSART